MSIEARKIGRKTPQSDPICVRDFFQSWNLHALQAVRLKYDGLVDDRDPNHYHNAKIQRIAQRMDVDEDTVKELAEVCAPENLMCGDEPRTRKELLELDSAPSVHLECVRYQMEQRQLRDENQICKSAAHKHMKYSHVDEYTFVRPLEESCRDSLLHENRVTIPNILISVQVSKCLLTRATTPRFRPSDTFQVLGTQTLADLKDAIRCPVDEVIAGDYSSMPDIESETLQKAKDIYKSGFFFIENVFYNDLRLPDNKDYSKPILEWAKSNWPNKELSVSNMATTQLLDLRIKLGCYYLFTHQGNCEHSVLFQDLRLFTADDAQDKTLYPLRVSERIKPRRRCQGCNKISAQWVVFDSPLIPTDPCFFCQICFKTFLYTKDGQKTSNFKAHHYAEYCL